MQLLNELQSKNSKFVDVSSWPSFSFTNNFAMTLSVNFYEKLIFDSILSPSEITIEIRKLGDSLVTTVMGNSWDKVIVDYSAFYFLDTMNPHI